MVSLGATWRDPEFLRDEPLLGNFPDDHVNFAYLSEFADSHKPSRQCSLSSSSARVQTPRNWQGANVRDPSHTLL